MAIGVLLKQQFAAVCCSVAQCGAAWCSVVQRGTAWCSVVQYDSAFTRGTPYLTL